MLECRDERQMRALTGLSTAQFDHVLAIFAQVYHEQQQTVYEQGWALGTRRRRPGGGAKGKLPTMADKLYFVLYYYKNYPTFDVLATHFGMARSKACANVHKWTPLLTATLLRLGMLPCREFKTPADLHAALQGVDCVLIDATERPCQRAQDATVQREHYSGKQKRHTLKNTTLTRLDTFIVFLGHTFSGHTHDYTMLKSEFPPEHDWFTELRVLVDLGYLGMQTDYRGERLEIPTRKPRQRRAPPAPQLTDAQKAANRTLSQVQVHVENAIGGLKRYTILVQRFRNHKENFADAVIGACAGLWNFALTY